MTSIFEKQANNFNLVRLLAALLVIYSHSYAWTQGGEWLARHVGGVTHAGELSVVVFFFISGALVTKSLAESRSVGAYLVKRATRIYPALIVCCLFVAYFVTWAFGGTDLGSVLHDSNIRRYFTANSIGLWNIHFVPGVFETHPQKGLNGSLWSITLELRLYLFLALLYLMGVTKDINIRCLAFITAIGIIAVSPGRMPLLGNNQGLLGTESFPDFSIIFLLGGIFYSLEKQIRLNYRWLLIISIGLVAMSRHTELQRAALFVFAVAASLCLARSEFAIRKLPLRHDYSYGVYLYGWPSQQIAYALLHNGSNAPSAAAITLIAMPLALLLAALSWHFVEKPCLRLGQRFGQMLENRNTAVRQSA
ncbi:acyltransferase family protein [Azohydromonas lata]|uniref:acyltransferase family protein n=1 Tax=Azohydromonas lata TaxID=45677 RepID=UPI00082D4AA9|nr:acyltransferase [Azohydromonas lata]